MAIRWRTLSSIGCLVSLLTVIPAQGADDPLWDLLKKGGLIVLMRNSAVDEGAGDPKGYNIKDCATQRNLTDKGRAEAKRIGEAFKSRGIPIGRVLSSQFCRCKDTAQLAFGKFDTWEALNSFLDKPHSKSEQTRLLHQKLEQVPRDGNLVLVTHGYNIVSATGLNPDPGDMLIISAADKKVGYKVVGELSAKK